MFDEDDFAAALARLDELGAAEPIETRTPGRREPRGDGPGAGLGADRRRPGGRDRSAVRRRRRGHRPTADRRRGPGAAATPIVANCRAVAALGADAARVGTPGGARFETRPVPDHRELRQLRERVPQRGRARRPGTRAVHRHLRRGGRSPTRSTSSTLGTSRAKARRRVTLGRLPAREPGEPPGLVRPPRSRLPRVHAGRPPAARVAHRRSRGAGSRRCRSTSSSCPIS